MTTFLKIILKMTVMLLFTEIILNGDHSVSCLLRVKLTTIKTPFIWKVIQIQFMESALKTLKKIQSISMCTTEMEKEIGWTLQLEKEYL